MALGYGIYGGAALDPYDTGEDSGLGMTAPRIPRQMRPEAWAPDEALPLDERIRRRMESDAALSTAPAPGRFSVLGSPMSGQLPQPDFLPEKPMAVPGTEDTFLNRLGPALAQLQTARLGPHASNMERFLASMLTSGARTWGTRRTQQVDAAEARQQLLERRAALQNERNAQASANAREERIAGLKASSAAEKKARAEREGWLTVPGYIATAMGDPKLVGTQVPPEKYNAMLATWRAKQSGSGEGGGSGRTLDRKEALRLSDEFRNADGRLGSMRRRLESLTAKPVQPTKDMSRTGEDPAYKRYAERVAKLEDDITEQEARAESAYRGLSGMGMAPQGAYWKPATVEAAPNPGAASAAPAAAPAADEPAPAGGVQLQWNGQGEPQDTAKAQKIVGRYAAAAAKLRARSAAVRTAGGNPELTDVAELRKQVAKHVADLRSLGYSPVDSAAGAEVGAEAPAFMREGAQAAPAPARSTGNTAGSDGYAAGKVAAAKAGGMTLEAFTAEVNANAAVLRASGHDPAALIALARKSLK